MRYIFLSFFFLNLIFANEYYAKLEPIESFKIKAAVAGKITFVNRDIEGKKANNSLVVKIDSTINQIDLEQSKKKLRFLNEMIRIEKNNYKRLMKVSSKSAFEKDLQKLKYLNLESSKVDLLIKIETLKDIIKNKNLIEKSNYIFNIFVNKADYVNPGVLLYEAKDLTKGKLEFFVPISTIKEIENKIIYLDGKRSNIKIDKIFKVADSTHISSYKIRLILENIKTFSRLVKIEFK